MAPTPSTVSFTVRRPTPASRPSSSGTESDNPFKAPALPRHLASARSSATGSPLARSPRTFEDSDDDGETGIIFANGSGADDASHHTDSSEEVTIVKQPGRQRLRKTASVQEATLVIPAKPNPDWREAARRRRAACSRVQPHSSRAAPSFVPNSALATTGADGSVGGLGTRDTINSGPQLVGLQVHKMARVEVEQNDTMMEVASTVSIDHSTVEVVEETEDQRALRAILAGEDESASVVEFIPVPSLSEEDALKQDVQELPDVASAEDYERVPISAFGAAMLRGMGWTDGAVSSKSDKISKNGLKELYLPQARPALLGIGAKEREPDDSGSGKKKPKGPDMRYIPVTRKESAKGENGPSKSGTVSRRGSRSPLRRERDNRVSDRDRSAYDDRDHDGESRRRTKDYDERDRERRDYKDRDKNRDMQRDRGRERKGKGREYDQRDRTRDCDRRERRDDR